MNWNNFIIVQSIFWTSSSIMVPNIDNTFEQSLSECILYIAKTYFGKDAPIAVQTPSTWISEFKNLKGVSFESYGDILLQALNEKSDISLLALDYLDGEELLQKNKMYPGAYIIVLTGEYDFMMFMQYQMISRLLIDARNKSAMMMIVSTHIPKHPLDLQFISGNLLQSAWQLFGCHQAIVMLPDVQFTKSKVKELKYFQVYTWFPESQHDPCIRNLNKVNLLDHWIVKEQKFSIGINIFPDKKINNMRNCTATTKVYSMYPFAVIAPPRAWGSMLISLQMAVQTLNLRLFFIHRNSTRKTDLQLPSPYDPNLINDECTLTYPNFQTNIKWYVPGGISIPRWKSLTKIFSPLLWVAVCVTFVMGTATLRILQFTNKNENGSNTLSALLLNTLAMSLGQGVIANYTGAPRKMVFLLWLFYFLVINTAYQSALVGFLTNPGKYPPIQSLVELFDSNLHLRTSIIVEGVASEKRRQWSKYDICHNELVCLEQVATEKATAVLIEEPLAEWVRAKLLAKPLRDEFTSIDNSEDIVYFGISIDELGCLLHKRLDDKFHRLFSSGIIHKLSDEYNIRYASKSQDFRVLTSFHLQGSFFILIFGILLSTSVFIYELVFHS
ncbi:Ionotropic receptor 504 [Blattella germanica]|nr:Ionotropic receptor 504 [Blattella germanica]